VTQGTCEYTRSDTLRQLLVRVGQVGRVAPSSLPVRIWGVGQSGCPDAPGRRRPRKLPCGSAAHRRDEHTSWEGVALPDPPRGRGLGARASGPRPLRDGETRFPHPPRRGRRFTSDGHAHGAPRPMNMPWERGRPARATAPRARRRPPPGPSPTGGGHPAPPPSGGRLGGGRNPANDGHLRATSSRTLPRRFRGDPRS